MNKGRQAGTKTILYNKVTDSASLWLYLKKWQPIMNGTGSDMCLFHNLNNIHLRISHNYLAHCTMAHVLFRAIILDIIYTGHSQIPELSTAC